MIASWQSRWGEHGSSWLLADREHARSMPLYSKDVKPMNPDLTEVFPEGTWEIPLRGDQPTPVKDRPAAMFEVRESDHQDQLLFAAMLEQTYQPFRANPWVAAVLDARMAPMRATGSHTFSVRFDDGETYKIEVLIERIRRGRTLVVRFQLGPIVHLWSMSSAASTNADGDNDFTSILVENVRSLRPQVLIAANISRLVRSDQEGGLLLKVLPDHVDEIWAGPQVMKLVGEGSEYGRMMFSVLGAVASMERNWIVMRLMTGRIAAWRRGEWLYGRTTVPFGYRIDERRLVPVPELREQVRSMLLILGDDAPPSLTIRRLADQEVPMLRGSSKRLLAQSARARNNPRALVDSFLAWSPLWVAGEYVWRFTSPMKDVQQFVGIPVMHADDARSDRGEVQLLMTPGVPEGGWAEQEVLDRVALVASKRFAQRLDSKEREPDRPLGEHVRSQSSRPDLHDAMLSINNENRRPPVRNPRRRGTRTVAAFSGYSWVDDTGHYELKVAPHERYQIVRRTSPNEQRLEGRDAGAA